MSGSRNELLFAMLMAQQHRARSQVATPPATQQEFAQLAASVVARNDSLWRYFFPRSSRQQSADVRVNWNPATEHCHWSNNCHCGHVLGSRDRQLNPKPLMCEGGSSGPLIKRVIHMRNCTPSSLQCRTRCRTGSGSPCLYSDMNPGTSISVISLMRAAGLDHIIEEGREGGLSAFIYALHGLRVTSVEYLPEDEPTSALQNLAPSVRLLTGDGSKIIPDLVDAMTAEEAARTLVFYDGEKRVQAYRSYRAVRAKVGMAAFDDSHIPEFRKFLDEQKEVWWETNHSFPLFAPVWTAVRRTPHATQVQGQGHTTFVVGGGWTWRSSSRGRDVQRQQR